MNFIAATLRELLAPALFGQPTERPLKAAQQTIHVHTELAHSLRHVGKLGRRLNGFGHTAKFVTLNFGHRAAHVLISFVGVCENAPHLGDGHDVHDVGEEAHHAGSTASDGADARIRFDTENVRKVAEDVVQVDAELFAKVINYL